MTVSAGMSDGTGIAACIDDVRGHSRLGRCLNGPLVSKSPKEAAGLFGFVTLFLSVDNPVSSQRTRELLGWRTTQPELIPDFDRPSYFKA
jgi:hypothetical protein